jgi:hypothetical protein
MLRCVRCLNPHHIRRFLPATEHARAGRGEALEGKIHGVDPDFRSTLTVSNRASQSNCWVSWKITGQQPCGFQVPAVTRARTTAR